MSGTKVTGLLSHLVEEGGESGGIPTSRAPALIPVRVAAEKSEKEMMLEAKRWLLKLGSVSALDAPQDVQDSLSDPRRNGVLLCEVVFGVDKVCPARGSHVDGARNWCGRLLYQGL